MALKIPFPGARPARILVIGDGDSPLAARLAQRGHRVTQLLPSDFHGQEEMVDVVAVLPGCPDAARIGAVAAACARCIWFQDRPAPAGLTEILAAAGIPVVEDRDLGEERK